eukprot:826430-Pyramimonas_sp.AAC.1
MAGTPKGHRGDPLLRNMQHDDICCPRLAAPRPSHFISPQSNAASSGRQGQTRILPQAPRANVYERPPRSTRASTNPRNLAARSHEGPKETAKEKRRW